MIRRGYRNANREFEIDSKINQFNFNKEHIHLKIDLKWTIEDELAPVERVNIFLSSGIVINKIFVVDTNLFYYYEKRNYFPNIDYRSEVPVPKDNLLEYFEFSIDDIVCIKGNNMPKPAKCDFIYYFKLYDYDRLDTNRSIDKNIFYEVKRWQKLPSFLNHDDILYYNKIYLDQFYV
jgi:hypothetical protein